MKLSNNTILITGGGSGIGRGLAEQFQALGNQVIIAGRREAVLQEVADANPGMGICRLDVDSPEAVQSTVDKLLQQYPDLNAVFHVAGIMRNENLLEQSNLKEAEHTIQTNLIGPMQLTSALLPHFLNQKTATIMTVTSGLAYVPLAMTPTYCATKAAIHSYTQSLRYQLKDTPVQVLELVPPYVQTELMGSRQANDPAAMPLKDFITEVMQIMKDWPDTDEICVERVNGLRYAEKNGSYDQFFQQFNDSMLAARATEWKQKEAVTH